MTPGLSETRERHLVRALQFVLAALVVYGLVSFQLQTALTAGLPLGVTLLPAALRREYGYVMDAGLVLWLTVAVVLHTGGSLGLYRQFSWYDEVTHAVSAAIVAGGGYATLRAFEMHSDEIDVGPQFRAVFVVIFALAFGVLWEVFEYGAVYVSNALHLGKPVKVFGIDDIVTDMVFNAAGAVAVALWGTRYFGGLSDFLRRRLRS